MLFGSDTGLEGEVCRVTSRGVISLHIMSRSVCRQNFFVCENGLTNEASKPSTGLELHNFVGPVHLKREHDMFSKSVRTQLRTQN